MMCSPRNRRDPGSNPRGTAAPFRPGNRKSNFQAPAPRSATTPFRPGNRSYWETSTLWGCPYGRKKFRFPGVRARGADIRDLFRRRIGTTLPPPTHARAWNVAQDNDRERPRLCAAPPRCFGRGTSEGGATSPLFPGERARRVTRPVGDGRSSGSARARA